MSTPEVTPDGPFQLEVSSPGVERTLRTVKQFQRYVGTEITVKTSVAVGGERRHHGVRLFADDRAIQVGPPGAQPGTDVELRPDQIDRARTVLVWGSTRPQASKTGASKRRAAARPTAASKASAALESKDTGS